MAKPSQTKDNTQGEANAPELWYVIDTTAQPDHYVNNVLIPGARTHEQIVGGRITAFKFEMGKPVPMAPAIAFKFLKEPAFIRTDESGNEIAFERTPKQPDELGAGEKFVLEDGQTIARYDELTTIALLQRIAVIPDGERFAMADKKPERREMIEFIVAFKKAQRKANTAKEADRGKDEFEPDLDPDDEMAA